MMTGPGTIETGAVLSALVLIAITAAGFAYRRLKSDIEEKADNAVADRVDSLESAHAETRRLSETAYSTVHGDSDRPEDDGFVVESRERWERLENNIARLDEDVENLAETVGRLEASQDRHQRKTEAFLDAITEELGLDVVVRDGGE